MATHRLLKSSLAAAFAGLFAISCPVDSFAQVSLTALDVAVTQNFDALPATGSATWTNNSTLPGWFHARTGTGTTVVANDGSNNGGALYSYGAGTNTDRALGSLGSGNAAIGNLFWGIRLQNNTGAEITSLDVSYVGEQWRTANATAHTAAFSYVVGTPTVTGLLAEFQSAGTAVAALSFTGPINVAAASALDGNLAANRVALTASITGLSIPVGTEIMLRWSDPDNAGSDHGLSIDDFSVTPRGAAAASADLSVGVTDSPDPVNAGSNLTYTIAVGNAGPDAADTVSLTATVGAGTTFVSLTPPAGGWTCTNPAVGAAGAISCSNASLAVGTGNFSLVVAVDAATADGTTLNQNVAVNSTTADPMGSNNTATEDTTVGTSADLSISMTDTPNPVLAGGNLTYAFVVANAGPSNANTATWSHVMPAGTLLQSFVADPTWTCTTPAVGTNGTVTCNAASLAPSSGNFSLIVQVDPMAAAGSLINASATTSSATPDPNTGNNTSTVATTVSAPSTISGTKSAAGTFAPGGSVTYTIVLSNSAASAQADNPGDELVDVLPAGLSLVSATATSGTALATLGTNTVTWNGGIAAAGSVTITINATIDASVVNGVTINNQGTINFDADGNGSNEATALTDDPATPAAGDATAIVVAGVIRGVPAASDWSKLLLMSALMLFAGLALRRQSA